MPYSILPMRLNTNNFLFHLILVSISCTPGLTQLSTKIDALISHPNFDHAEVGISIRNESGEILYEKNASQNLIPASLQKIITNFAALEILGENYQFITKIGYSGNISPDGTLNGDIIIFGNGDPSLASERYQKRPQLDNIVSAITTYIKRKGITCIDGMIICDASYYGSDGVIHSWAWNDVGNYYATSTWSINIHENYYNLFLNLSNNPHRPPEIFGIQPAVPGISFKNELTSGPRGSGDQAFIFGAPYTYHKIIRGSLPTGTGNFKIKGSIPDSPQLLAGAVAEQLSKNNIDHMGFRAEYDIPQQMTEVITQIKSPMLKDLVQSANLESINLYCESFLSAVGEGNRQKGILKVKQFLSAANIDTSNIQIEDGSGLSFWNSFCANDCTKLLNYLLAKYGGKLYDYFPRAGESGTLSYMFKQKEARGKLWAKSGSMQQVMNYAGFTKAKSGKIVTFCILVNRHKVSNRDIRSLEEGIMNEIYLGY